VGAPGSDLFQSIVQFKQKNCAHRSNSPIKYPRGRRQVATLCNTLQHTATAAHCNTLKHTATNCNTAMLETRWHVLMEKRADRGIRDSSCQRAATHCNTLQHTETRCNTLLHTAALYDEGQFVFPTKVPLQHAATRCNTLQHTAKL